VIGSVAIDLDARFGMVRTQETNCGNWIADVMRQGCKADIGLCNSGTLRADIIYEPGPFSVEDLMKCPPTHGLPPRQTSFGLAPRPTSI
jgi:2',3'-cyclic-nucleotide 2'-phosphodiesterase (5'-nucleotidase family)